MWCFLRKGPLFIDKKRQRSHICRQGPSTWSIVLCSYQTVGRRFNIINNYIHWSVQAENWGQLRYDYYYVLEFTLSLSPSLDVTVLAG